MAQINKMQEYMQSEDYKIGILEAEKLGIDTSPLINIAKDVVNGLKDKIPYGENLIVKPFLSKRNKYPPPSATVFKAGIEYKDDTKDLNLIDRIREEHEDFRNVEYETMEDFWGNLLNVVQEFKTPNLFSESEIYIEVFGCPEQYHMMVKGICESKYHISKFYFGQRCLVWTPSF